MLTRRQFAVGSAAFVSSGLIGGRSSLGESVPFSTPLPIPRLIDAARQGNALKLKVMSGFHAFIEGKPTRTLGYAGPVLGPVIRLRRGDEVEMTVENKLDVVTTVHWHGLLVPGSNDGGPQQLVRPGQSWRPVLKIDHEPRPFGSILIRITTQLGRFIWA
jgi:FtsP/CotA-like multicopper oxidase with cupredoxin domain